MIRSFSCFFLCFFVLFSLRFADAAPTITAKRYRVQLQDADRRLARLEERAPRNLAPILKPLAKDRLVKRDDGTTQFVSGTEFASLLHNQASHAATRETVFLVRQGIQLRLGELEKWSQSTFVPSNAQAIIKQLENTNQIRTGPTWFQQIWLDFHKWRIQMLERFTSWLNRLFPAAAARVPRQLDPVWIQIVFFVAVAALLALIGYLIYRVIETRKLTEQERPFAFSPEDSALLQLSPNELRQRAQNFAERDEFREALRHLYIALLLTLDEREVWSYDPRRTNREHIAALESQTQSDLLSALITSLSAATWRFDRVRYGHAPCTRLDWDAFQEDVKVAETAASNIKDERIKEEQVAE